MAGVSRREMKGKLEVEIRWVAGRRCFNEIRAAVPELAECKTWDEVWAELDGSPHASRMIERLICAAMPRVAGPSSRPWQAILVRSLWVPLQRLAWRRRGWDEDQDELWQALVCCLLETIHQVRVPNPGQSLIRKILNGTTHRLHDHYRKCWQRQAQEFSTDNDGLIEVEGAYEDPGFDRVDESIDEERCLGQLKSLCGVGGFHSTDALILIAAYVYDESLRQSSARCGARYEAVKKRRQRARKKLRRLRRIVVPVDRAKGPLQV